MNARPSYLPSWAQHFNTQPTVRLSVDPEALAADCALSAGQIAQAEGRVRVAETFYGFILSNLGEQLSGYFRFQALKNLASIENQARAALHETEIAPQPSQL